MNLLTQLFRKGMVAGFLCLGLSSAYAQSAGQPVTVHYEIKVDGITLGRATHTLKVEGNRYTLTDLEEATGIVGLFANSITRKSVGTIVDKQLQPARYSETVKNKSRIVTLNWKTMSATFTTDPNKKEKFVADTVDRASFAYQYYFNGKIPSGTYSQMVADVKKVEEQKFRVVGTNTVETPMGNISALQIDRAGDHKNMSMWIAPKYNYLPVRMIYIDKKGHEFDLRIKEIVK